MVVTEQVCWWIEEHYAGWSPPKIAVGCMVSGIAVIMLGAALVHPVTLLATWTPLVLLFYVAPLVEVSYRNNTKAGTVNQLQQEWPNMVVMHLLALVFLAFCLHIDTAQALPARVMAFGTYLLIVPTLYILATNTLPPRYQVAAT